MRHQQRVRDQDPGGVAGRPENAHRLARLDEQRLVIGKPAQLADDGVEGFPGSGGTTGASVHDQVVRVLRDLRVEVIHEHPQGGFLLPALAGQVRAARRTDRARAGRGECAGHRPMVRPPAYRSVTWRERRTSCRWWPAPR